MFRKIHEKNTKKYYAVFKGEIYETWEQCKAVIESKKYIKFKSFHNLADAEYFQQNGRERPAIIDGDEIYTDGACNGFNQKQAGIGVYFGYEHPWNVSEKYDEHNPTNQKAEIYAIIRAIQILDDHEVPITRKFKVFTDSLYCVNAYSRWIPNWNKNGWKTVDGLPVKNKNLLEEMHHLLSRRQLELYHVRGHQDCPGNIAADRLATQGSKKK